MAFDINKIDGQDANDLPNLNQNMGLWDSYNHLIYDLTDPRVKDWPLMGSPIPIFLIVILYLLFVLRWGPSYMKDRKPCLLTKTMIFYNISIAIANGFVFYGILTSGYTTRLSLGCEPLVVSYDPERLRMASWIWVLVLLKCYELGDTVIFVLRKKFNQATCLHVYHHASVPILLWIVCRYAPGEMWSFILLLNCFVHVFMYTYYLLACLGPEMQKRIQRWKRYITIMQMVQFIIMALHTVQALLPGCDPDRRPLGVMYMCEILIMIVSFSRFYQKSYTKKQAQG